MNPQILAWLMFAGYVGVIIYLAWLGSRRTDSLASFAVGARQASPFWVGLSLAANMTSAATFIINPGLIYLYGVSGVLGYAIAMPAGVYCALIVMTKRFRSIGNAHQALTVPHWVGERYADSRMKLFYALISMLQITFIVLILVGLALVLSNLLHVGALWALAGVILFTFTYVKIGGATAHVMTNSFQGILMIVVAVIMLASGPLFVEGGFSGIISKLREIDPVLLQVTNPSSALFRNIGEVFVANFLIGIAIINQPHILSKAFYLRDDRDVNRYLATTVAVTMVFFSVIVVGLYARASLGGELLAPDRAVVSYLGQVLPPTVSIIISIGLLGAGFSTLEGLLLAISAIFSNDIYKEILKRRKGRSQQEIDRSAYISLQWFTVALAIAVFFISKYQLESPDLSVAIFAQNGVYGLFTATFPPIFYGTFVPRAGKRLVWMGGILALIIHFLLFYTDIVPYTNNPGVAAAIALVVSNLAVVIGLLVAPAPKRDVG